MKAPEDESRRRVGRPSIPREHIVEAALQVVDDGGATALSMRSLAQHLHSSTATLYRHFPNRAVLVEAVIDRIIGEIDLDSPELSAGWKPACRRIATDFFEALDRHTSVALLLADHSPVGPNGAAVRERWLSILLDCGFPVELAARSGAMMSSYVQGFAILKAGERETAGLDDQQISAALKRLNPADFPATAAVIAARVLPIPLEEEFTFGLEALLEGLDHLLDNSQH